MPLLTNRRIATIIEGGSALSTDSNPFAFSYGIQNRGGHQSIVKNRFKPIYDEYGPSLFGVHRPFGEPPAPYEQPLDDKGEPIKSNPMDLDALVELRFRFGGKFKFVIDDYIESRQWAAENMPGAMFLDYLGTPEQQLTERLLNKNYSAWQDRLNKSVGPLLNLLNVNICLDAASGGRYADSTPYDTWAVHIKDILNRDGRDLCVEAVPSTSSGSFTKQCHILCTFQFWTNGYWRQGVGGEDRWRPGWRETHPRYIGTTELQFINWLTGHSKDKIDRFGIEYFLEACRDFNHIAAFFPKSYGLTYKQADAYLNGSGSLTI